METQYYRMSEAAGLLGISRVWIYYLHNTGKLQTKKIGGYLVVSQEEVERYKNSKQENLTKEEK